MKSLTVLAFVLTGLLLLAEETREQKEKRLADAMAELLELMDEDPVAMSEEEAEKRHRRGQELEETLGTLAEELAGKDPKAQEKLAHELLKKHRPDAAAKLEKRKDEARETQCKSNLKQLGVYVALYESKKRAWPETIGALRAPDLVTDEKLLACPVHGGAYLYVKPPQGDDTPASHFLIYCPKAHPSGARAFCLFTGAVRDVREAVFEVALKAGNLREVEPRVKDLKAEYFDKDGKVWLRVRGTIENLADPKLAGVAAARATVTVRLSRDETGKPLKSPALPVEAKAGARETAFSVEFAAESRGLDSAMVEVEDGVSGLEVEGVLELPPASK